MNNYNYQDGVKKKITGYATKEIKHENVFFRISSNIMYQIGKFKMYMGTGKTVVEVKEPSINVYKNNNANHEYYIENKTPGEVVRIDSNSEVFNIIK